MGATVTMCTCSVATGTLCDGHRAMREGVPFGQSATTYRTLCDLTHTPTGEVRRVHLHCAESGKRRLPSVAPEFEVTPLELESAGDCGMIDCPARPSYLGWE